MATEILKKLAPEILSLIKSSHNILLHCHPSPDPDSVGSALAMKLALESLGKKVTVIGGDSEVPQAFAHFPGFTSIEAKTFFEIDLAPIDLFIIQDAGSPEMVSRKAPLVFPPHLKTVVIDHHMSNQKFARDINLLDTTYPATTLILFDLFKEWGIHLTPDIATNLFIGAYTDTGGFKFQSTTADTLAAAAELARIAPDFHDAIFKMENSREPDEIRYQGLAFSHIETFLDGHLAMSTITHDDFEKSGINIEDASAGYIANQLKSVIGWDVAVCIIEMTPGHFKGSLRTRNSGKYDLSKIAVQLGGGGHKSAAGIHLEGELAEVQQKIVDVVKAML